MSVRMTPEEVEKFLSSHHRVVLVTIGLDGTPLPTPLWYANRGATLYVGTIPKSQKVRNVQRDPRVSAIVEDGEKYSELRSVIVKGRAEPVEEAEELDWFTAKMSEKYASLRPKMPNLPKATQRHYDRKRTVLKIVPEQVITWDNSKLRSGFDGG